MRTKWGRVPRPQEDDSALDDSSGAVSGQLQIIDRALCEFAGRRLVSSVEVVDLLLDVRSAIVLDATSAALFDELEVRDVSTSCRGR